MADSLWNLFLPHLNRAKEIQKPLVFGGVLSPISFAAERNGAAETAGPYKGLGESAPVSGGASMRAAGDAGPYGSESGAVSKFENISKRTDISTSRAGARSIPLKMTGKEQ